jgi:hypothetical protein
MKTAIAIVFASLISSSLCGQDPVPVSKDSTEYFPDAWFYLELGGNGILYSINFEQVIFKKNNVLTARLGMSYFPFWGNSFVVVPFELDYLIGRKRTSLELGVGIDFIVESYQGGSSLNFQFVPRIGFRHYNIEETRYMKIGYTPIIDKGALGLESDGVMHLPYWFGIGFGFIFGEKH